MQWCEASWATTKRAASWYFDRELGAGQLVLTDGPAGARRAASESLKKLESWKAAGQL